MTDTQPQQPEPIGDVDWTQPPSQFFGQTWTTADVAPYAPPLHPSHVWRNVTIGAGAVIVAVLTVGIVVLTASHGKARSAVLSLPAAPTQITSSGMLTLTDPSAAALGCDTSGDGYDDITNGAEVIVSDDAGATLQITTLGAGRAVGSTCVYLFPVDVKAGLNFYGVTVTHRGTVKFAESAMSAGPALTLGN